MIISAFNAIFKKLSAAYAQSFTGQALTNFQNKIRKTWDNSFLGNFIAKAKINQKLTLPYLVLYFLIITFFYSLTSLDIIGSLKIWAVYAAFISIFFVGYDLFKKPKVFKTAVNAFIFGGTLVALIGIYQQFFGNNNGNDWFDSEMFTGISLRVYSTLGNPNVLGEYLLLAIPITFAMFFDMIRRGKTRRSVRAVLQSFSPDNRFSWASVSLILLLFLAPLASTKICIALACFTIFCWLAEKFLPKLLPVTPTPGLFQIKIKIPAALIKLFYFGAGCVMLLCMVFTQSRGCWLALILTAFVFVIFVDKKLLVLFFIALFLAPFILPQSVIERFISIGNTTDTSTQYRVFIWLGTLNMLRDYWTIGVGLGMPPWNKMYPFYAYSSIIAPHAHNVFLQILAELGIIGLIVFGLIILSFIGRVIRRYLTFKNIISVACMAGILGFLLQGMFDYVWYNYRVFLIFWIFLAIGATKYED